MTEEHFECLICGDPTMECNCEDCTECGEQFDDNPGKRICKTCEDWLVTEKESI